MKYISFVLLSNYVILLIVYVYPWFTKMQGWKQIAEVE